MDFDQYFEFSTLSGKSFCRVSSVRRWVDLRTSEVSPFKRGIDFTFYISEKALKMVKTFIQQLQNTISQKVKKLNISNLCP